MEREYKIKVKNYVRNIVKIEFIEETNEILIRTQEEDFTDLENELKNFNKQPPFLQYKIMERIINDLKNLFAIPKEKAEQLFMILINYSNEKIENIINNPFVIQRFNEIKQKINNHQQK